MITLYGFGPTLGMPDGSPYVMKAEILLRMAGLAYRKDTGAGPEEAPKGKLPFIDDAGEVVADTTFIRAHIERKYGFDFDRGLDRTQRAAAWTAERMIEDHLYWCGVHMRWADDAVFAQGAAHFFDAAPEPVRDKIRDGARTRVLGYLHGHGLGRHRPEEVLALATRSLEALSTLLGERRWLMGTEPCGTDAAMTGILAMLLSPALDTALRRRALAQENLAGYVDRAVPHFFPDFAWTTVARDQGSSSRAVA